MRKILVFKQLFKLLLSLFYIFLTIRNIARDESMAGAGAGCARRGQRLVNLLPVFCVDLIGLELGLCPFVRQIGLRTIVQTKWTITDNLKIFN